MDSNGQNSQERVFFTNSNFRKAVLHRLESMEIHSGSKERVVINQIHKQLVTSGWRIDTHRHEVLVTTVLDAIKEARNDRNYS